MIFHPVVQFKPIKRNALVTYRNFRQTGPDLGVEPVAVHSEVERGIPLTDKSREQSGLRDTVIHLADSEARFSGRKFIWAPATSHQAKITPFLKALSG